MLASAILLCGIHSATHGVELQERVNFFFIDYAAELNR
jgi:hypothetical protein